VIQNKNCPFQNEYFRFINIEGRSQVTVTIALFLALINLQVALTCDRFSAICFPFYHSTLRHGFLKKSTIFGCFLVALGVSSLHMFWNGCYFDFVDYEYEYEYEYDDSTNSSDFDDDFMSDDYYDSSNTHRNATTSIYYCGLSELSPWFKTLIFSLIIMCALVLAVLNLWIIIEVRKQVCKSA
jgi:Serpentine type 7TM GPCR chemoreceptor Srx